MKYQEGFVSGLPNCGIVAISSITETSYTDVWNYFKNLYKAPGQWRGRTRHRDFLNALAHFGYEESELIFETKKSQRNKAGCFQPTPIHIWGKVFASKYPGAKFLIRSSGHAMALHNDMLLDQSNIAKYDKHPCKGKRVTHAWIVK